MIQKMVKLKWHAQPIMFQTRMKNEALEVPKYSEISLDNLEFVKHGRKKFKLGRGRFADVFLATYRPLGTKVAVKRIRGIDEDEA